MGSLTAVHGVMFGRERRTACHPVWNGRAVMQQGLSVALAMAWSILRSTSPVSWRDVENGCRAP
jgi:hypothetical protein